MKVIDQLCDRVAIINEGKVAAIYDLNKDPNKKFAPYDGVWFEDAATQCGEYAVKYLSTKKN